MSTTDSNRLFNTAIFHAASTWILDELLLAYEVRMDDAAWAFYKAIEGKRDAASLLGRIWERQVHKFFTSRTDPFTLTATSLEGPPATALTLEVPVGIRRRDFDFRSYLAILEDAIQQRTAHYLVPIDPNFPTIDSVFYKPDEAFYPLQMTLALNHPPKVAGFKRLQKWTKLRSLAAPLRPNANKPWHLIFVVPKGSGGTFSKQGFVGTETDVKVWAKKIRQFVLELPKDEVLKAPSLCVK
jgi:hypothetical protein